MNDLEKALYEKSVPWTEIEFRTKNFWVFKDAYPVTPGHLLFVPTHKTEECVYACFEAAYKWGYNGIDNEYWDGFNIGQNCGIAAGQTVMYPHVHMIPRRTGDIDDPTGGIRSVIPARGNYKNKSVESISESANW